MLPVHGPWTDTSRFTDTALLADIATRTRDAALGVCLNRNLTGEHLARAADRAAFTAAAIDDIGATAFLRGRDAEDQVTLVLAANRRSPIAAAKLLSQITPAAALRLHTIATTTRFKGATALLEALREHVAHPNWAQFVAHHGFDLAQTTIAAMGANHVIVPRILASQGHPDQLIDLTPTLLNLHPLRSSDHFGDPTDEDAGYHAWACLEDRELCETLLLATAGHPDVVVHWAEHGGGWGRLVAAMDHRLDPALLIALGASSSIGVVGALLANPALDLAARADLAGRAVCSAILHGTWSDIDGIRQIAYTLQNEAEEPCWYAPGHDAHRPETYSDAILSQINEADVTVTRLVLHDLLASSNPNVSEYAGNLLDLFIEAGPTPPNVIGLLRHVRDTHGATTLDWIESYAREHAPELLNSTDEQDASDLPLADLRYRWPYDDYFPASITCAMLTTSEQYVALYDLADTHPDRVGRRHLTVKDACTRILLTHPDQHASPIDALLPNALGAL